MNFLIIGAGGIGCYYGARLQLAGHAVSYMARGEHLAQMQQHGLRVSHEEIEFHEKVSAFDGEQLQQQKKCADFDLIILASKGGSTASILADLSDWLAMADTPVLSVQNGVDNEILISDAIGEERTLGGLAVKISGHIISPANVHATGPAKIVFGPWQSSFDENAAVLIFAKELADIFGHAGIDVLLSTDIRYELWRKLLINNGVNPLSALTGLDTKTLTADPALTKTVYKLMEEVAAVAKADNVILQKSDIDEMYALICNFDAIKTSMLVDKEKGRPLELDSICGAVLRRAQVLGIETSVTALINSLLLLQE
jgi:2-dehydropantoate 2-reductase